MNINKNNKAWLLAMPYLLYNWLKEIKCGKFCSQNHGLTQKVNGSVLNTSRSRITKYMALTCCPTACVTRRWVGRDEFDLTENVRAQNQLLLAGRIPPDCPALFAGSGARSVGRFVGIKLSMAIRVFANYHCWLRDSRRMYTRFHLCLGKPHLNKP